MPSLQYTGRLAKVVLTNMSITVFLQILLLLHKGMFCYNTVCIFKYFYLVASQNCIVGSQYETYTGVPDPQGWYLNLQLPATCSGNVTGYNAYPLYSFNGNGEHTLVVAMWTPTGLTSYQKVMCLYL